MNAHSADQQTLLFAQASAAGYYYTNAKEPEAIEELLRERFKHFTIGARKLTGLGCPDKMMECPGGFCVLTGRKCDQG